MSPHSHFSPFSEQSRKIILSMVSSPLTWTTMKALHLGSLHPQLFPTVHSLWSHRSSILKMFMLPLCFRHPKAHHPTFQPEVLTEFTRSAKAHHLLPLSLYLHCSNLLVFFLSHTPSMAFAFVNAL